LPERHQKRLELGVARRLGMAQRSLGLREPP